MSVSNEAVGNEIFLQGKYINVGVNGSGTLGTNAVAPKGIYTNSAIGFIRLGMWADFDGFNTGRASTIQDVMLKGTPVEGFSIGIKSNGSTRISRNMEQAGLSDIDGTTSNLSTASIAKSGWSGTTSDKLAVSQVMSIADGAKYVKVELTLTNRSSQAMDDVRYLRSIDPDQGTSFSTDNKIVSQGGANGALVSASVSGASPFFYYSADSRAVVSTYGRANTDPYANAAYASPQAQGYTIKGDNAVNIDFALGTLGAGQSTKFVFYMGVTDDLNATIASIGGSAPVNTAPIAANDSVSGSADAALSGNVLANDRDPDGDTLTANLKAGPANGTLTLASDGKFTYVAKAGFTGTDSFTYTASDGRASDTGTVTLAVVAKAAPAWANDPIFSRAGTADATDAADQVLTGADFHNSFFVDSSRQSGSDRITNFAHADVLVVTAQLSDQNGDGLIALSNTQLKIDGANGSDMISMTGVSELRALGLSGSGLFVYADASTRPIGAIEGKLGDDTLAGDGNDNIAQIFFFDTALDLDLGSDTITRFGSKDIVVTTSALPDGNRDGIIKFGADKAADFFGGSGAPGDVGRAGEAGRVGIFDVKGNAVTMLEFDGRVVHDGSTYYVYSLTDSAAGLSTLGF